METFSWKSDFKRINWPATALYNLIRSASAGIVWFVIMLFTSQPSDAWHALGLPLAYFAFLLPLGLFCAFLIDRGVPLAGLVTILFALILAVGDPLLFVVHKIKPTLLPVDRPGFFNFKLIIFVMKQEAPDLAT